MHLDAGLAVFQGIGLLHRGEGQLARLADRDEAAAEPVGQGGADDEAPGVDADHGVDMAVGIALGEGVDEAAEGGAVPQQGRDVVELHAGLGPVGNGADVGGEKGVVHGRLRAGRI